MKLLNGSILFILVIFVIIICYLFTSIINLGNVGLILSSCVSFYLIIFIMLIVFFYKYKKQIPLVLSRIHN